jgi:hypothetical protein
MQCSESSPVIIYTPNILICGKIDRFAPDFSEKSIPESIDDGPHLEAVFNQYQSWNNEFKIDSNIMLK